MLRYESEGPRAVVTIDDPERHNPLSNEAMAGLADAVSRAAADEGVRVVVITGAGDKAFSAGGDLSGGFMDTPIGQHGPRQADQLLLSHRQQGAAPRVSIHFGQDHAVEIVQRQHRFDPAGGGPVEG